MCLYIWVIIHLDVNNVTYVDVGTDVSPSPGQGGLRDEIILTTLMAAHFLLPDGLSTFQIVLSCVSKWVTRTAICPGAARTSLQGPREGGEQDA